MIKRALLFPSFSHLENNWWHRLATVVFWAWFAFIVIFLVKITVLDPFASCVSIKYSFPESPSDLDCGSNPVNYAASRVADESLPGMLLATALLSSVVFIAGLLPSIAYRMILYVAKGKSWRDPPSAA